MVLLLGLPVLAGALAVTATSSNAAQGGSTVYVITDLGTLQDADGSRARAINDAGQIVGAALSFGPFGFEQRPVLWQGGQIIELPSLGGQPSNVATDINNGGLIVGYVSAANPPREGPNQAVLWENGQLKELETLSGGENSRAFGINDDGLIVGFSDDATGAPQVVVWDSTTLQIEQNLGFVGEGLDINDGGEIVGSSFDSGAGVSRPFFWNGSQRIFLGQVLDPNSASSTASGLNAFGQVVGSLAAPNFEFEAFFWAAGTFTSLGTFDNAAGARAVAVNDSGQIVGSSRGRAVIWENETSPARGLPETGLSNASDAADINLAGQIVGSALFSDFQQRGALWEPAGALTVPIDIKPGDNPNSINTSSNGVVPVAILTADDFDATTVDGASVTFGPDGATEAHGNAPTGHLEDADGDGDTDLVFHFRTQEIGIPCDAEELSLSGQLLDGTPIVGTDAVQLVGRCS